MSKNNLMNDDDATEIRSADLTEADPNNLLKTGASAQAPPQMNMASPGVTVNAFNVAGGAGTFGSAMGGSVSGVGVGAPSQLLGNTPTRKRTHSQRSFDNANFGVASQSNQGRSGAIATGASNNVGFAVNLAAEDQYFVPLYGWPLFEQYHKLFKQGVKDLGQNVHGHRGFLVECNKHKDIVCGACGGYGHHSKVCPTLVRLRKITQGCSVAQRLLGRALDAS